ncbi:hypothetical protein [Pseudomonas sp.]|uniref:hypothetical protein n=1 Tax=Pseudomonas sp. TaxID=306 RepID=UPI00258D550E|nr:hypothetical protein [Pseudomonas sp.]
MSKSNIWYLPGPFHQYQEDVKALAKRRGLVIVDANATGSREGEAENVPEVTVRQELRAAGVVVVGAGGDGLSQSLRDELAGIGVIVESFAEQRLERPAGELGDTARRLFQVLEAVNDGVARLQQERSSLTAKVEGLELEKADLLKQLEVIKPVADPEVDALKATLDKAGISYRANASKESLEKLVAELGKA